MDIKITNLCKSYNENQVLKDFTYTFEKGGFYCVMGKSGRGKTTLLNILMGLEKKDSGEISGLENKKISAVFQENRLCENLNALTNVRIVAEASDEDIVALLNEMGINESVNKPVSEYSGGMKRRVAIARALMAEFDVLFMDEALKGLDDETKLDVVEVIKKKTANKTVIMVTHNSEETKMFNATLIEL